MRPLRTLRALAVSAVAASGVLIAYRLAAETLVTRADDNADRDTTTGWLRGAEPQWLGREDASDAVLMVHGFVGAGTNFNELPARLAAAGLRVRVMRLPGHGTSPREFEAVSPTELLDSVRQELAELKRAHERVFVVGHSMGGTLATLAAAEDGADGVVLGAPYFGVTHHWYYGLSAETWMSIAQPVLRWVYKGELFIQVNRTGAKPHILSYAWVPLGGLETLAELGHRANAPETLQRIRAPVLLLHGPGDVAASPDAASVAVSKMASTDKRAVYLDRSNHHIFWDHDREQVVEEVLGFVERLRAQ
jgi:carboxylesterase